MANTAISDSTQASARAPNSALSPVPGIACSHLLAQIASQWGSALPTLVLTLTLAWLTRPMQANLQQERV